MQGKKGRVQVHRKTVVCLVETAFRCDQSPLIQIVSLACCRVEQDTGFCAPPRFIPKVSGTHCPLCITFSVSSQVREYQMLWALTCCLHMERFLQRFAQACHYTIGSCSNRRGEY